MRHGLLITAASRTIQLFIGFMGSAPSSSEATIGRRLSLSIEGLLFERKTHMQPSEPQIVPGKLMGS